MLYNKLGGFYFKQANTTKKYFEKSVDIYQKQCYIVSERGGKDVSDKRGGKREGSGRKATGRIRKPFQVTWPIELVEKVDKRAAQEGLKRSQWLEKVVREKLED